MFLTGATGELGELGREVLRSLLVESSATRVTVLVRPRRSEDVESRCDELRRYVASVADGSRIDVVRGDVSHPRLGLARGSAERLKPSVTHVIHAAASIRLDAPLAEARATNVGGTEEVLAFAGQCTRLARYAHVGTAFVCGDREGRIDEDDLDRGQGFVNAYERSKLEAEVVVRWWGRRLPVTVLRPSIVVGAAEDGRTACFRSFYLPLRRLLAGPHRRLPGDGGTPLDLVPVDLAGEAVARLTLDPIAEGRTYHVTAGRDNVVTADAFLAEAFRLWGRPGEEPVLDPERSPKVDPLAAHLAYLSGRRRFDDRNLVRDLGSVADRRPLPFDYLPRLLAFCRRTAWGRRLPWRCEGGLRCAG